MANLSTAQRSKIRRLSQPKELSPDEEGGELNIVPFLDIIVNILIFVLATVAVTFTSTIQTARPPSGNGQRTAEKESLSLKVLIATEGFSLKTKGGNVAPGCTGMGTGLAVPKKNGKYDYAGLKACASKLKASNEAFAEERVVTLTTNPGTDYQLVIDTVDALRDAPSGGDLFPEVLFGIPN